MGQDDVPVWEAGGHDRVREGDRGRQLDQSDVITAKGKTMIPIQEVMTNTTWFMLHSYFPSSTSSFQNIPVN